MTLALSLSCAPLLPYSGAQAADHGGRVDQGSSVLPNLGDSSDMSPAAERRLGDRIARELYRDPDYLDDPVIMEYVNDIWRDLIAASRARGEMSDTLYETYAWDILVGRSKTVNAFALPGGYFGLYLGLVGIVGTRDELASVLAHELSHVTQRHISRSMSRQSSQAPWVMGAMILGVLAASKNANGGEAVIVGGQAAAVQSQLNYSRGMEREADRIGFNVSTQAGFAPQGFVGMFEKLQQSMRLNDAGGFPYLRTHPLTTERIADMQTRVQQSMAAQRPNVPTQEHMMVTARARVLSDPSVDAMKVWGQQALPANLATQPEVIQVGVLYGAALAALQLHDDALADATLARLQAWPSLDPAAARQVQMLGVEMALARGRLDRAQSLAEGLDVTRRDAFLLRVQVDERTGQAALAAQNLRTWLAGQPRDAQAWQWLSAASTALGNGVAAVRAEAEADVAHLDYPAALRRLRAAQDLARKGGAGVDEIEAAIVDTRIHALEALVKEQAGAPH